MNAVRHLTVELRTTSSRVAEALRAELLDGVHPPGTPLRDVELAMRTGVSRPTVREALAELARDGLVVHSLYRGMEVARITTGDVREIYATRRMIEGAGAAALARTGELAPLADALAEMTIAVRREDRGAVVQADVAFHAVLAEAAGVRRLARAHNAAMLELRLVLSMSDRVHGDLDVLLETHERLLALLADGTARAAVRELDRHLAVAQRRVCDMLAAESS